MRSVPRSVYLASKSKICVRVAQLDHRQRGLVEHADGELAARDEPLEQRVLAVLERLGEAGGHLLAGLRQGDAVARTLPQRLDDQRQADLLDGGLDLLPRLRGRHEPEGRRRDVVRDEEALGGHLVHPRAAGLRVGAGVRDPGLFEQPLNPAVLAEPAVQGDERQLRLDGEHRRDALLGDVHLVDFVPLLAERFGNAFSGLERHLALR